MNKISKKLLNGAGMAALAALALSASDALSQINQLHVFQANTPASAQEVNDNFTLLQNQIASNSARLAVVEAALTEKLDRSGGTITGNLEVTGTLDAGFYLKTCAYPAGGSHGDCRCNGNDFIVSGGTWANASVNIDRHSIRENRALDRRTWRVACVNEHGRRTDCMEIFITCARFGDLP